MFQQRSSFAVLNLVYYFFFPYHIAFIALFSWIFRGSSSRSSTRTASRLYGASTFFFFFFFFYNSISRLYNPQEFQGRIWYKPATFAVRSVALRRTIVDGVKHKPPAPGLSPPQLPHALACVFFFREKERLLSKAALLRRNSRHRLRTNRSGRFRDVIKTVIAMFR